MTRNQERSTGGRACGHGSFSPSDWVERYIGYVGANGIIADIACGRGRHLRLGVTRGYRVVGVDRDLSGVADLANDPRVDLIAADLEADRIFPLAGRKFDGVIVTDYLWRPIFDDILACVAPTGVLIYETFAADHARLGTRPSNPQFLLAANELIDRCAPTLTVIAYEEVHLAAPRERIVQRIVAVGRQHVGSFEGQPPMSKRL